MAGLTIGVYSPGTVGSRIIHALLRERELLGVGEVIVFKRTPDREYVSVQEMMRREGAHFAFQSDMIPEFGKLGIEAHYERREALSKVDLLIDCSAEGIPLKHKPEYEKHAPQCRGFVCQGAEEDRGFGKGLLVYGVNDHAFDFSRDRWIQIGSCNTHAGSFLMKALGLSRIRPSLLDAQFVFIRRSLDLNQKSRTVISTEISKHTSERFGTHHAEDIARVFRLLEIPLEGRLLSSAIKINEPYFHVVSFFFTFEGKITKEEMGKRLAEEPRILQTTRRLVHYTYQFATTYSFLGRFSNPVIVVDYDVFPLAGSRWQVRGHAFTPQDGNFLLSNLAVVVGHAFPRTEYKDRMRQLEEKFLCPVSVI